MPYKFCTAGRKYSLIVISCFHTYCMLPYLIFLKHTIAITYLSLFCSALLCSVLFCLEIDDMPPEDEAVSRDTLSVDIKYLPHIYPRTACSGKHTPMISG